MPKENTDQTRARELEEKLTSNDEMQSEKLHQQEIGNEFAEEFSEGPYGYGANTQLEEDYQSTDNNQQ
jgi:hypothetical protein